MLANVYLHPLDHPVAAAGGEWLRYADDFLILCQSAAQADVALAAVRTWVAQAGLTLHPEKPPIVAANQRGGFDFLGDHFERGLRWPRKKSLAKLRDRLRAKTLRTDERSLRANVADVNGTLRGWPGVFQHSQATAFAAAEGYGRRRLRSLLEKRCGRSRQGRGGGAATLAE